MHVHVSLRQRGVWDKSTQIMSPSERSKIEACCRSVRVKGLCDLLPVSGVQRCRSHTSRYNNNIANLLTHCRTIIYPPSIRITVQPRNKPPRTRAGASSSRIQHLHRIEDTISIPSFLRGLARRRFDVIRKSRANRTT